MNIEVRNVKKQFGDHVVLDGISYEVNVGESLVIIGGSGSGKSTLMNVTSGILEPTAGSVLYDGEDITKMNEDEMDELRKEWGFCFQDGALFGSKTVFDNVALPIREHTDLAEEVIENMVKIKLDMVGLTGFGDLYPSELSGGMIKRAALARALALDPEVLFCDEPASGLDPIMSAAINQLILDLTGKTDITSLMVTHSMESAFTVADRIIFLHEGEIKAEGTPEDIKGHSDGMVQQFVQGNPDGPIPLRQNREQFIREMLGQKREEENRPSDL